MVQICSACAKTGLQTLPPCATHHASGEEVYQELGQDVFLYNEELADRVIRLIEIENGSGDDEIRISLKITSMDTQGTQPEYQALSYVWGSILDKKTIICNSVPLEIGQNLHHALWQIREDGDIKLPWWVDAVCINQKNISEKNVQVRMMKEIYENAYSVLAWIGQEIEEDAAGFALLQAMDEQLGHYADTFETVSLGGPRYDTLEQLGLPPVEDPQWRAMMDVLYRDYFYRIWIIQEILVAQRCSVKCGTQTIDRRSIFVVGALYELFQSIKNAVSLQLLALLDPEKDDPNLEPFSSKKFRETVATLELLPLYSGLTEDNSKFAVFSVRDLWIFSTCRAQDGTWDDRATSMATWLSRTAVFKATEPKDKIFALVGLSSDVSSSIIDYTKSTTAVQIEVAKIAIERPDTWGPLLFSGVNASGHSSELPSWMPDWLGAPVKNASLASYNFWKPYYAGSVWWRIDSSNVIHLPGKIFDTVEIVVHEQPYNIIPVYLSRPQIAFRHCLNMVAWYYQCLRLFVDPSPYFTGESVYDAFWRTLVCNREAKGLTAPDDLGSSHISWISTFEHSIDFLDYKLSIYDRPRPAPNSTSWTPWAIIYIYLSSLIDRIRCTWEDFRCFAYNNYILPMARSSSQRFEAAFTQYAVGRKFFRSVNGLVGWLPMAAQEGDMLCLFQHSFLPFVIRPCPGGYTLIGEAYVHGVMDEQPEDIQQLRFETIELV